MKRTTFRRKSTAKAHRGTGRRVYKVADGWRVSPECPRSRAARGVLIAKRPKRVRHKRGLSKYAPTHRKRAARRHRIVINLPF